MQTIEEIKLAGFIDRAQQHGLNKLQAEELEISYYQGDFIDLTPIICEQIILQIPIKPLCSEECKGLCPHCGINMNVASCSCHLEFVDPRLAVLKNIKIN